MKIDDAGKNENSNGRGDDPTKESSSAVTPGQKEPALSEENSAFLKKYPWMVNGHKNGTLLGQGTKGLIMFPLQTESTKPTSTDPRLLGKLKSKRVGEALSKAILHLADSHNEELASRMNGKSEGSTVSKDQTPKPESSEPQSDLKPKQTAVFIKRAKGMPIEEFAEVCVQRFREAGLFENDPPEGLPRKERELTKEQYLEELKKPDLPVQEKGKGAYEERKK